MIATIAVALVVASALALAINLSIPALRKWLEVRRWNERDRPHAVATDSAIEEEEKRLADLNAELGAAETGIAEREREISVKLDELTAARRERIEAAGELARQEAALAERERILEQSRAEATRSAADATAEIEAREAALAAKEAGPEQPENELATGPPSAAERDLIWWEKQLGGPRSAEK